MIRLVSGLAVVTCLLALGAGPEADDAAPPEMRRLDWMVGQWKGEGWIQAGPQRRQFAGTETVRRKIGGMALLIEGNFRTRGAPADAPPVHETLAVMAYDGEKGHFWLNAWLRSGRSGKYEARAESGEEVRWFIPQPQGQIRYTIKLDEKRRWSEVGEMSPDGGTTWHKFFEMTLEKAGE